MKSTDDFQINYYAMKLISLMTRESSRIHKSNHRESHPFAITALERKQLTIKQNGNMTKKK